MHLKTLVSPRLSLPRSSLRPQEKKEVETKEEEEPRSLGLNGRGREKSFL